MDLFGRIIAAIAGFLLFGFIGAQDAETGTQVLNSALAGACLMILVFDFPQTIKKSDDSDDNEHSNKKD